MRILFVGAHQDDAEIRAGGLILKHLKLGNDVKVISMTNGCNGSFTLSREEIMKVRREEIAVISKLYHIEYEIMDNNDSELEATIDNRKALVRSIRAFNPDLIITHRPNDYHADHRYTSLLVQDASYMLTVPMFCEDVPALPYCPVIVYGFDNFKNPEFSADVVMDISDVVTEKFKMLACHKSQVYGFMPHYNKTLDAMPEGEEERLKWLMGELDLEYVRKVALQESRIPQGLNNEAVRAIKFKKQVEDRYGKDNGIIYVEAFQVCEFGRKLTDELKKELFPF